MRILSIILLTLFSGTLIAQPPLVYEDMDLVLTNRNGFNVPRSSPVKLVFRKNSLVKTTTGGYVLLCGDDSPSGNDHNLDGAVIQGNWFEAVPGGSTHGMMLGFNVDYDVKFNYMEGADYGFVIEGALDMRYESGGLSYNIIKSNETFPILLFGPDNVRIYNNTFYSDRPSSNMGLLHIKTNTQHGYDNPTIDTKVKNNIFYAVNDLVMIAVDEDAIGTLECDYNVYYSESGNPRFRNTTRSIRYTWDEWRALGFDTHSVVMDPRFRDHERFVPSRRLDYGTDVGQEFAYGMSDAIWEVGSMPDTIEQDDHWQVGAVILDAYGTGIETSEEVSGEIHLFPNPNTGSFTVTLDGFEQDSSRYISLLSMDGKFLYEDIIPPDENVKEIDVQHLTPGFYILRIMLGESIYTTKFIKV